MDKNWLCHLHYGTSLRPGADVTEVQGSPFAFPYYDAFGTNVSARDLIQALERAGLVEGTLILEDAGLRLEHACDLSSDMVAKALTELRGLLSPLTPCSAYGASLSSSELSVVDTRQTQAPVVHLAEYDGESHDLSTIARDFRFRAKVTVPIRIVAARSDTAGPDLSDVLQEAFDETATFDGKPLLCAYSENPRTSGVPDDDSIDLFMLVFAKTNRSELVLAMSRDVAAIDWFRHAVYGDFDSKEAQAGILLDGLEWEVGRRPIIAAPSGAPEDLLFDRRRCDQCGLCGEAEPAHIRVDASGVQRIEGELDTSQRYDLIELCPSDAIRPRYSERSGTLTSTLTHRPLWLSRLLGGDGPAFPSDITPSYLRAKNPSSGPRYVLGLAAMTMQEHAAVLLRDGEVIGAIEEERPLRRRHHGWRAHGRPAFVTAAVDPTICVEEVFCRRSIQMLLQAEGITLEDVELIALNGLHGRYRNLFSRTTDGSMPLMKAGRVVYVPHHLCHAASSYRVSGLKDSWIFTVDGRGDRETAALFRAENGTILPEYSILSLSDTSIGGLYESATRLLGFGSHGQGSFMALASFASPSVDISSFLSVDNSGTLTCHESGFTETFSEYQRAFEGPIESKHHALAASVQDALESSVERLIEEGGVKPGTDGLCLAGGVTLNCQMNDRLRRHFRPKGIYVQPAANDAGTALGAALEAWSHFGDGSSAKMDHAYLGPEFSDETIESALKRSGLSYNRSPNVGADVAKRLAGGEIFCFFQHRMEFGPRALGARSIVADPRSLEVKNRANALKTRQGWRPFGPSVLAGYEDEYFEEAFDTRFMLFTQKIKPEKLSLLPAIAHVDGTTRPQIVHPEPNRAYHDLISEFHRLTGIPMVLNTSFNRRGEPIVCSPEDALESFVGLGADGLAIGSFIVERPTPDFILPPMRDTTPRWFDPIGDEILFLSSQEHNHDAIVGERGNWRRTFHRAQSTSKGVTVLLLANEFSGLGGLLKQLLRARVRSITFRFPQPILTSEGRILADHVPTLNAAASWLARVASPLKKRGLDISIQMVPSELLPEELSENVDRFDPYDPSTPITPEGTWPLYLELMGTEELARV
jgi:predicted NodU family carbamoyl transferase